MNIIYKASQNTALVFLYIIGTGFAGALIYQTVIGQPLNNTIVGLLYGIIAFAINSNGVKSGVDHTNETVNKVALAQYPITPDGIAAAESQRLNEEKQSSGSKA